MYLAKVLEITSTMSISKKFYIGILAFWLFVCAYGQEDDSAILSNYEKFKKTFNEEMEKYPRSASGDTLSYIMTGPAIIPGKIFRLPRSGINQIYTIGISDPGMHPEEGYELATIRAKSLIALFRNAEIQHLMDLYTDERSTSQSGYYTTKYIDFYRILALMPFDTNAFKIIEDTINIFGETTVHAVYTISEQLDMEIPDTIFLFSECLNTEVQANDRYEINYRIELKGLEKSTAGKETNEFHFLSRKFYKMNDISSIFNGKEIELPPNKFKYKNIDKANFNIEKSDIISCSLKDGLWNGFIESVLQNLFVHIMLNDASVSSLSDLYSSRARNLGREIAQNRISFKLKNIIISDNKIQVELNYLN